MPDVKCFLVCDKEKGVCTKSEVQREERPNMDLVSGKFVQLSSVSPAAREPQSHHAVCLTVPPPPPHVQLLSQPLSVGPVVRDA